MRTAVACFVLAAAIATPGIVLAATSSSGPGPSAALIPDVVTASGEFHPTAPQPVDSRLRPAVGAVTAALKARGETNLKTFAAGPGVANVAELPSPGQRCATLVLFQITGRLKGAFIGAPCGHGSILRGNVEIDYTPKSLGPTIRKAMSR